jgi:hypothetical protein
MTRDKKKLRGVTITTEKQNVDERMCRQCNITTDTKTKKIQK